MKSILEQKLKEKSIESSSTEFKTNYKLNTLAEIFHQFTDKTNRYIFYCPDIVLVNNLVKLIYETAYEAHKLGNKVVILHEINGFKCQWLLKDPNYSHLKDLEVDYIIKKKSSKSKKTKSQYGFKPSDTLIVPDQFQEMYENLVDVKIIQKVLLVSSYAGISAMQPGIDYNHLGVDKLVFTEKILEEDYKSLYNFDSMLLDQYPINKNFFAERNDKDILPLITISNIGNNELTQQVINIFYNKYPNLRVFQFRILDRDNMALYQENISRSALLVVLDKMLGNSQMVYEALSVGLPVATFQRDEIEPEVMENIFYGNTAIELADNIAGYCQYWLTNPTSFFTDSVKKIKDLSSYNYTNFGAQVKSMIDDLKENRIQFFSRVKDSIMNEASDK